MTAQNFTQVATYQDLLQSMADLLNLEEGDFGPENIEGALGEGHQKVMEFSRRTGEANEGFFYDQLKANRLNFPIVDCLLVGQNGEPSGIWIPTNVPPSYKDVFFHSLHRDQLFHLLYRHRQQLFFLEEDRTDLGEVIGDSEVWTYGPLGNSREDAVCSAFVQNQGRFGHLKNRYVMGELNHHQNRDRKDRIPGIRINNYPGLEKPVVITPYNQVDMAAAGTQTMTEKQGWKRIEIDIQRYPDLYKQFVLAAFHAYLEETGYERPAIFWHLPNDRSVKG